MLNRFDHDARAAVVRAAHEEARALGSTTVEAEHLLLALAADEDTPSARMLAETGLDHDGLCAALERETARSLAAVGVSLDAFPSVPRAPRRSPTFAASAKRVLHRALQVAAAREDRAITAPHLLIGILRADIGTVPRALDAIDVDRVALGTRAEALLG